MRRRAPGEFASRTFAEWKTVLAGIDAPWAPVQAVEELLDDPQVLANDYIGEVGDRRRPDVPAADRAGAVRRTPARAAPGSGTRRALRAAPARARVHLGTDRRVARDRGDPVTQATRPVPVPDERSAPFWEAAAAHVLTVARCSRCEMFSIPPDIVCSHCHRRDPAFVFEPVSGRGSLRSWTVVRQSFLPGFDDDLPFVLADVELDEQADLRMIGRLLDGPDVALHIGDRVRGRVRGSPVGLLDPRVRSRAAVSVRFNASNDVAIVGYAHSQVQRHAPRPLGAIALDTARVRDRRRRARRFADRRLHHWRALPHRRRARHRRRGQHRLLELARRAPRRQPALRRGLPGLRPDSRRRDHGGQRGRERRGRLRADAPRAAQPTGSYHVNPMQKRWARRSGPHRRATSDRCR